MLDATGLIISWNDAALRLYGYDAAEIPGMSLAQFYSPQDVAAGRPQLDLKLAASQGLVHDEAIRIRKNGDSFWASTTLTLLRDEHQQARGFALTAVDATAQKQAEARRHLMVELALNALILVDRDGIIVQVNPQTDKMFGYRPDELNGQSIEVLVPEGLGEQHAVYRTAFFENPSVRAMGVGRDLHGRRKDGTQFPVEIGLNPVQSEEGLLILGSVVDITERKLSEERWDPLESTCRHASLSIL